jgi:hypothetical protein
LILHFAKTPENNGPTPIKSTAIAAGSGGSFLNLFSVIAKKPRQTNLKVKYKKTWNLRTGFGAKNNSQNRRMRKPKSSKTAQKTWRNFFRLSGSFLNKKTFKAAQKRQTNERNLKKTLLSIFFPSPFVDLAYPVKGQSQTNKCP